MLLIDTYLDKSKIHGVGVFAKENAKKGEIKRLFSATLKSNKGSRVILNKFISQVA